MLKDFLPSQSQSWAKMKKQLNEVVRERKKKIKVKLSEIAKKTRKSSSMDKTFKSIMDSLTSIMTVPTLYRAKKTKNYNKQNIIRIYYGF